MLRPRAVNEVDFVVRVEGGTYGDVYRVLGTKPQRWVQQTDFNNEEAVGFLADRLAKLGIETELFKKGAVAGSTVIIGPGDGVEFDWEPTLTSTAELMMAPRGTDPRLLNDPRPTHPDPPPELPRAHGCQGRRARRARGRARGRHLERRRRLRGRRTRHAARTDDESDAGE